MSQKLAKFATKLSREIEWKDSFPFWLTSLAKEDMRAVAHAM